MCARCSTNWRRKNITDHRDQGTAHPKDWPSALKRAFTWHWHLLGLGAGAAVAVLSGAPLLCAALPRRRRTRIPRFSRPESTFPERAQGHEQSPSSPSRRSPPALPATDGLPQPGRCRAFRNPAPTLLGTRQPAPRAWPPRTALPASTTSAANRSTACSGSS